MLRSVKKTTYFDIGLTEFIFKKQGPTNTEIPDKRTEPTQKHNRKDRQKTKERIQNDSK